MTETSNSRDRFELRRQSDDLVYTFVRKQREDGAEGYQRQDRDIWVTLRPVWGWVVWDDENGICLGRPWDVLPHEQGDYPPEGDWVSRKGIKSYVYKLVYI